MPKPPLIRFGMIGCGQVTEKKSGPAFQKIPGCTLAAVMCRDEARARAYAQRHGVARFSTDARHLLEHPDIDAIYIATPPNAHAEYTIQAASHGKAVYVEKPMARTVAECEAMRAACARHGVPLFVAYYRRGQEKFLRLKQLMESGAIGEIRSFEYAYASPTAPVDPARLWLQDPALAGGGMLYDIGSHMLNMLLFLFGDVRSLAPADPCPGRLPSQEQYAVTLQMAQEVTGSVALDFTALQWQDCLHVCGTRGSLQTSIMRNDPLLLCTQQGKEELAFAPIEHVQQPYIAQMVATLQGQPVLENSGWDGLRTQQLLEALQQRGTMGGQLTSSQYLG